MVMELAIRTWKEACECHAVGIGGSPGPVLGSKASSTVVGGRSADWKYSDGAARVWAWPAVGDTGWRGVLVEVGWCLCTEVSVGCGSLYCIVLYWNIL